MRTALLSLARWGLPLSAALLGASADDRAREAVPCSVHGATVLIYEGTRLFAAGPSQLGLARGRAMSCASTRASAVIVRLERALASFPRERIEAPLRVHVDPRLPRREAPVTDIEVHASSREILLGSAALERLPPEAWTHELLHALAPAPPVTSLVGRRLWLALEEGLVAYLTLALEPSPSAEAADLFDRDALPDTWEELALPEYDPHPLARGLTRELLRSAPDPSVVLDALLDCLMAGSAPLADEKLREVSGAFVARCGASSAPLLASAAGRWLPEPLSPWLQPGARVVAARHSETR